MVPALRIITVQVVPGCKPWPVDPDLCVGSLRWDVSRCGVGFGKVNERLHEIEKDASGGQALVMSVSFCTCFVHACTCSMRAASLS